MFYAFFRNMNNLLSENFFGDLLEQLNSTLLIQDRYLMYLEGLSNTIIISLGAVFLGVILGIIFATIKYIYKLTGKLAVLERIVNFLIFIVRGTPVVLQLMIMYFVILFFISNGILVSIITFGINSGAYVAETFRGGLESVDIGQYEAGRALGLDMRKTIFKIIIPQAIKTTIPAIFNEFIALVKETSVAGYIAIKDITYAAYRIQSRTMDAFFPLIISALIYLVIVWMLTMALKMIERRLRAGDKK